MSGKQKIKEESVFERALDLILRLQAGQRLTSRQIAEIYGLSYRMGCRIFNWASLKLPVRIIGEPGMGGAQLVWMK